MATEYKEMQQWGDTAANLAATNPTPRARQLVFETDTHAAKLGDGATAYNALPYATLSPITAPALIRSTVEAMDEPVSTVRCNGLSWYQYGAASPDIYYSLASNGTDGSVLTGNTGYVRQATGTAVVPYAQAMMRRCVLKDDGSGVLYYLDCDDSTKIAGTWSGSAQAGWLRVHEGYNDPVRPIPGQTITGNTGLRELASVWQDYHTYDRGSLVLYDGKLWVSLADDQQNKIPAPGTSASTLDGTVGQVMVEVPRFYTYRAYAANRHAWDICVDPSEIRPFPTLTVASTAPTTKTVDGLTFTVHPAFQKAGVGRSHRYYAAFRAYKNGTKLESRSGVTPTVSLTRSAFRTAARARNTGLVDPSGAENDVWQILDMHLLSAIQLLFLTEFRTFCAQSVLGGGNQFGGNYVSAAGRTSALGNCSGAHDATPALVAPVDVQDDDGVLYRGIEDFFGTAWVFVDGQNGLGDGTSQQIYLCNTPANFADNTDTNYTLQTGVLIPATGGSFVRAFHDNGGFFASDVGGSSATYATDGAVVGAVNGTWYIAMVGGSAATGGSAGAFALLVSLGSAYWDAGKVATLAR